MIRLLFVIGQLDRGGTETQLLHLVRGLQTTFSVSILVLSDGLELRPEFEGAGARVISIPRTTSLWDQLRRVLKATNRSNPDIVHTYGHAARIFPSLTVLRPKTRLVASIRTDPRRFSRRLDRLCLRCCDEVLVNSRSALRVLQANAISSKTRSRAIHNGVSLELTDSERSSYEDRVHRLICVANLRAEKGLDVLLRAFATVLAQRPSCVLTILGEGPSRLHLEELSVQLGIQESVRLHGSVKTVQSLLLEQGIGILSSRVEGLPNAVLEYMAASLPVVATTVGGVQELIQEGREGLLVAVDDAQGLAKALLELLADPVAAEMMGIKGRRRALNEFSVDAMVASHSAFYNQLIGSSRKK